MPGVAWYRPAGQVHLAVPAHLAVASHLRVASHLAVVSHLRAASHLAAASHLRAASRLAVSEGVYSAGLALGQTPSPQSTLPVGTPIMTFAKAFLLFRRRRTTHAATVLLRAARLPAGAGRPL
jgi:hypothetical protein